MYPAKSCIFIHRWRYHMTSTKSFREFKNTQTVRSTVTEREVQEGILRDIVHADEWIERSPLVLIILLWEIHGIISKNVHSCNHLKTYYMPVRQKSMLRVNISTKRKLLPPCEPGRLDKVLLSSLLSYISHLYYPLPSASLVSNHYQLAMPRLSRGV